MKSVLNHVAILVESIEAALEAQPFTTDLLGEIEEFPSEGTRELYVGNDNQIGRLLLMQAIGDGPYQNALNKRGPGLHHIALDVLNIDEFVTNLSGSGWLLHPKSIEFYKSHKQIYLSRPTVPVLMEIQERKRLIDNESFIEELEFPFEKGRLLESLCCERLNMSNEIKMKISGREIRIKDLLKKL